MSKLILINEEKEKAWNNAAKIAAKENPIKGLKNLPNIPGITKETKKFLKLKGAKYLLFQKRGKTIIKYILKHPFRYTFRYLLSSFKKKSYARDGDFFLYGVNSIEDFKKNIQNPHSLILFGFSYCQKPFECPEGRFTKGCIADPSNSVCLQCDIGKVLHLLPSHVIPVIIPTIHDIGEEVFALIEKHPDKKISFLITACEMTLEMFGDFGNMVGIKGMGIRLDGRICNTMRAFELSEHGVKPGLTVVTSSTQERILDLVRSLSSRKSSGN